MKVREKKYINDSMNRQRRKLGVNIQNQRLVAWGFQQYLKNKRKKYI